MKAFKTESKKILDLMINSIYENREVFLRELISNASDALDKARMAGGEGLTPKGEEALRASSDALASHSGVDVGLWRIDLAFDQGSRLLTVSDNGIGMDAEALERCLGTIAHSDSRSVKDSMADGSPASSEAVTGAQHPVAGQQQLSSAPQQETDINIIGQFGVGFYSAFMVADKVVVTSRAQGSNDAWRWESDGVDGYTIAPAKRETPGTDVVLHIRESTPDINFERFLDQSTLVALVQRYSNYIRYPIVMNLADEHFDEQTGELIRDEATQHAEILNSMVPLWSLPDNQVSTDDLEAFYCQQFHDSNPPLIACRAQARGAIDYDALLFVPAFAPADLFAKDFPYGLQLYSANVLIEDAYSDILPDHLRFVAGVVDLKDAQLNVSREALQQDSRIQIIARQLERRILDELKRLMVRDRPRYERFHNEYGIALKYAICQAQGALNEVLSPLLLFQSAAQGKQISFQEYLDGARPSKTPEIYYATGSNLETLAQTPVVSALLENGTDVLLSANGAQEELSFMILGSYHGATLRSCASAGIDPESIAGQSDAHVLSENVMHTLYALYKQSPWPLARITASHCLTGNQHPASRIATEGGLSLSMARFLNSQIAAGQQAKPVYVLEVNIGHPLYKIAEKAWCSDDIDLLRSCAIVLCGQAFLAEGIPLPDALAFNAATCALICNSMV